MAHTLPIAGAEAALEARLTANARAAARTNTQVSHDEEKNLEPVLRSASQEIRDEGPKGTHVRVEPLVARAKAKVTGAWAQVNKPGRGGKILSLVEIAQLKNLDPEIYKLTVELRATVLGEAQGGPLPVTLSTNHPGATLSKDGDVYVLSADVRSGTQAVLGEEAFATLRFDGQSAKLPGHVPGVFTAYELLPLIPEGYWAEDLGTSRSNDVVSTRFVIGKDAPGALTKAQALARGRELLLTYTRDVKRFEPDWLGAFGETSWEELVGRGIMNGINGFGDPAQTPEGYDPPTVNNLRDRYVFIARGPLGVYTEVEVMKTDGTSPRIHVEPD